MNIVHVARNQYETSFRNSFIFFDKTLWMYLVTMATQMAFASLGPPPPAAAPVEVFMKGENITGFNPANDRRNYYCFRIPNLLALPSGTIMACAEGRADGCRPDGNVNRPIVCRTSKDDGKTWGPIGIAGPASPHSGTNYPGAFMRDNSTVVLRCVPLPHPTLLLSLHKFHFPTVIAACNFNSAPPPPSPPARTHTA